MELRIYKRYNSNKNSIMKKLIFIIALFLTSICYSQTVDNAVKSVVKDEITQFSKTLDSVLVIQRESSGIFYVDTLFVKDGTVGLFEMNLTGIGSSVSSAKKYAIISNIAGKYTIVRNLNPISYSGYTGSKWDLLLVNGLPMVRITSPILTKWEYKRY